MTNYNHLKDEMFDNDSCETKTHEPVKTVRGVYKNLDHSPFEIVVNNKTLKFSSEAKKRKFENEMKLKTIQLESSFNRIYGAHFDKEKTNFNDLINTLYMTSYKRLKLK